jgi:hypothetical protein
VERHDTLAVQFGHAVARGVRDRAQRQPTQRIRRIGGGGGQQPGNVGVEQGIAVGQQEPFVEPVAGSTLTEIVITPGSAAARVSAAAST